MLIRADSLHLCPVPTTDFVSCLPVGYLEYMMDDQETAGSNNKSARLLRLFRLLKLLRLVRIKRIMERWEEELYGNRSIRIGKLIFLIAISSHWSCCGWFFSGDGSDGPPDGRDDGWVQRRFNTSEPADFTDQYFAAFFWSAMAIVKVGLADPIYRPDQDAEKFMTLISFFLGLAITSVIIGQVSDMIAHNNPAEKVRTDQIGIIHGFLHEKKIAPWLTRKIRGHFSNLYAERGTGARAAATLAGWLAGWLLSIATAWSSPALVHIMRHRRSPTARLLG
jgi:hypothetical protein